MSYGVKAKGEFTGTRCDPDLKLHKLAESPWFQRTSDSRTARSQASPVRRVIPAQAERISYFYVLRTSCVIQS